MEIEPVLFAYKSPRVQIRYVMCVCVSLSLIIEPFLPWYTQEKEKEQVDDQIRIVCLCRPTLQSKNHPE